MNSTSWWSGLHKSIGLGFLWLIILFIIDTVDSIFLLKSTTNHIKAEPYIKDLLVNAVQSYVVEIIFGYLLIGVLAGLLMHIFLRLWYVQPVTIKKGFRVWFSFAVAVSIWAYLRNIITQPCLHTYLTKYQGQISDALDIWQLNLIAAIAVIALLVRCMRVWPKESRSRFFRYLSAFPVWLGLCAVILHNPEPVSPTKNKGMNVLIIGIDALRPDHLKSNGYIRDTAPNIESLLQESVIFTQAFTAIARTYPSWVSILTGQWPQNNGIRDNLPHPDILVPERDNIARNLKKQGYYTSFITDDSRFSYMVPKMGFDDIDQPKLGLQSFALAVTEPRFRVFHGLLHNPLGFSISPVLRHNQAFGRSYRPELFSDAVIDQLSRSSKNDNFMMALHSCVLHAPGDRNYPYSRMYDQRGYKGGNRFRYSRSGSTLIRENVSKTESVPDVTHQDHNIYDSGMKMADELVADIVSELKASGLWDNTIVVLLSDHGEEMYEKNLPYKYHGPNHGYHPYGEGQHHVVLGIRFPDGSHKGKKISDTVRLIDLAPTLADHLSLQWDNEMDGKSLMPLIRGEEESEQRMVYIETGVSERGYWQRSHRKYPFKSMSARYAVHESGVVHVKKKFMEHIVMAKDRVLQLGKWKLIWRPTTQSAIIELYNREEDPINRKNLARRYPRIVAHLGLKMLPFLEKDGFDLPIFKRWALIDKQHGTPEL